MNSTSGQNVCITLQNDNCADVVAVAIMLSIFAVLGTVGNALVLFVFGRRKEKLSTMTMFIVALAITDFTISLFIMPFTVYAEMVEYKLGSDFLCKLYSFCITFGLPCSCFIMVAIAFDRYFGICHPFANRIDVRKTRVILFGLVSFACFLGILTSLGVGISTQEMTAMNCTQLKALNNKSMEIYINATHCKYTKHVDVALCKGNYYIVSQEFMEVYKRVYASFYIISVLIVTVLYGLIYRSVQQSRAHWTKTGGSKVFIHTPTSELCNYGTQKSADEEHDVSNKCVERETGDQLYIISKRDNSPMSNLTPIDVVNNHLKKDSVNHAKRGLVRRHSRLFGDENRMDNLKTALMLFIVTAVFIVFFMPAWLMTQDILRHNIILFYMYFVHNFSNPLIYAFLNESFKTDLKRMFLYKL